MSNKPTNGTIVPFDTKNCNQFVKCPLELIYYTALSSNALRLFLVLAAHPQTGPGATCYPGIERLQSLLQCSKRSVNNWLSELERFGFIQVTTRPGNSNLYKLDLGGGKLRVMHVDAPPVMHVDAPPVMHVDAPPVMHVDAHDSDLYESYLKRERATNLEHFSEDRATPLGDIAQPCSSGYVALMVLGGFTAQEAERWSTYPDLAAWIELAKTKEAPGPWLVACFKRGSKLPTPKPSDSRQERPRAAKQPGAIPKQGFASWERYASKEQELDND
jgi:hypothetical protein